MSYEPENHYQREKAPNKLYLPSFLTVRQMHADFVKEFDKMISYEVYRRCIQQLNISFASRGLEECEDCAEFSNHEIETKHSRMALPENCEACESWWYHIQRAGLSRMEYKKDRECVESGKFFVSSDMQKVTMLPREPGMKRVIFTHRLSLYNQSFVPLGKNITERPIAALWHSALQGRCASHISSTFLQFLIKYR
jgi:hypothetical protein